MSWNEHAGTVTRAFDEWKMADADIRAYMTLSTRFAEREYERIWDELAHSPADPDGPDLPDLFHEEVEGLWQHDYMWILHAAVIKEGVTGFEVYLEKAAREVLDRHGLPFSTPPGRTPRWNELKGFCETYLGVEIETPQVASVREHRHLLTHLRGELRTEEQREQFGRKEYGFPHYQLALTADEVIAALDALAAVVRKVDPPAWRYSWGCEKLPALDERHRVPDT